MQPRERTRLLHMLEAAEKAIAFSAHRTRKDLIANEEYSLAVVRNDLPILVQNLQKMLD
ncbi:MAG: hypothetical protein DHS20C20_17460 [Ardenticatenaceae bacterium]|nr:MAG: hypothetical protein DHS20C20_17460 [Ardenticatenaceae bacterium]